MFYAIGITYDSQQDEYRVLSGMEPGACATDEDDEVFLSYAEAEGDLRRKMTADPNAQREPDYESVAR